MMKKLLILIGVPLLLAACASAPPPPYNDAFLGLLNQASLSVPADQAVTVRQPIGLILSNNVEAYFEWMKAGQDSMRSYGALTNTVAVADADPGYLTGRVLSMLKRHYPTIEVVQDFNEAVAKGKKAVCLIDVHAIIAQRSFQKTSIDITAFFFDAEMKPVSRMTGHGEGTAPYPATDMRVQPSTDAAVQELDQKISALVL